MSYTKSIVSFCTVCLILVISTAASAETISLQWDPCPSPDIAGYKLYYKSGTTELPFNGTGANEGNSPIDVGTGLSLDITGLSESETHYFTVTAYDTTGYESSYSNIVISDSTNNPPVLSNIGNQSVNEGSSLNFTLSASDLEGDSLIYSVVGLPVGASFNPSTQAFSWTPSFLQSGSYTLSFSVTDGSLSDSESIIITVANTNLAPVLTTIGNKSISEGASLSFSVNASDFDGDGLFYSVSGLPTGASFNSSTRTFDWIPAFTQAGTYNLIFNVTDGNLSDSETLSINVANVNQAPVLTAIGSTAINEGSMLNFSVEASDLDGDNLIYQASGLPDGANFNPSTRSFNWTPTFTQAGNYTISFSVNDGSLSDEETLTLSVLNSNQAPVLAAIGDKSISESTLLSFSLSANDPDGDSLTYSASALPDGATFNPATRVFSWTPRYDQQGSYDLWFNVSDGSLSDSETLTVEVLLSVPEGLSLPADETGLAGFDRVDGLDDADNYVNGMPKTDVDFIFRVLFRDFSDTELPEVYLLLNGYAYQMAQESGDVVTGATYVFTTKLGPAAAQYFHFETRDAEGNILSSFPVDTELNGPQVELLNGKNVVSVPGNIVASQLNSSQALGTSLAFRRISDQSKTGSYALVDGSGPVIPGEGYVIKRTTDSVLPEVAEFGDNPAATYVIPVKTGWNLIANPYGGNVDLSEIQVQLGAMTPMTWDQAAAELLVIDGIYYYAGNDWGNRNIFVSNAGVAKATLVPHLGYWIYINSDNQAISLIVPKPQL